MVEANAVGTTPINGALKAGATNLAGNSWLAQVWFYLLICLQACRLAKTEIERRHTYLAPSAISTRDGGSLARGGGLVDNLRRRRRLRIYVRTWINASGRARWRWRRQTVGVCGLRLDGGHLGRIVVRNGRLV